MSSGIATIRGERLENIHAQLTDRLNQKSSVSNVEDQKKPAGVGAIAVLTILSALVCGFLIASLLAWSAIGGTSGFTVPFSIQLMMLSLLILGLASLGASIALLTGIHTRALWYTMMAIWAGLLTYSTTLHLSFWLSFYNQASWYAAPAYTAAAILLVLTPFIYAATCIAYFLTKKPRKYFHVKES